MLAHLCVGNRGLRLADQAIQMMLGDNRAKKELCRTERLSTTQLAPTSRRAQILGQSFKRCAVRRVICDVESELSQGAAERIE
jgi:hypothetical protein